MTADRQLSSRPGRRRAGAAAVLVISAVACASEESTSGAGASVPADARLVTSDVPVWAEGEAWSVDREPVLSLGVRDGPAAFQLFDVTAGAQRADGDLVVADGGSVRQYGPGGDLKALLGGPGSGPGEFQRPTQIVFVGDTILIWDDALHRSTSFDTAGTLINVHSVPREELAKAVDPPFYPMSTLLLSDGELLVRAVAKTKIPPTAQRFRPPASVLRVTPDLDRFETLMAVGDVEQVSVDSPWGPLPMTPPLARRTSIAVQPNEPRVCIGGQEEALVVCFEEDGSSRALRWPGESLPVRTDDPQVERWRRESTDEYALKLGADEVRTLLGRVPIPALRPVYADLTLDHSGNLWVRRGPTQRGIEYLVFDRAGRLLGDMVLPDIRVLEIGRDYVLGVYEDSLEVQHVQRFKISKGDSGP